MFVPRAPRDLCSSGYRSSGLGGRSVTLRRVSADFHADERGSFLPTMGFDYRVHDGGGSGRAVLSEYLSVAPGWPSAAVLLTFADVLIGVAASRATAPRISVTSSLTVHLTGPADQGAEMDFRCRLLKSGRSVTVGETVVTAGAAVIATAIGTFQASPRPQDTVAPWMTRTVTMEHVASPHPTFAEHVGLRDLQAGVAEIGLRPDLMNATEALQGGLVAFVGEMAARSAATAALGTTAVVDGLEVHYLAAARVGPFVARADTLGPRLQQVFVTDAGRDGRLLAVMAAHTRPASG